jgi:multidrug efflux pump subunit AcrB
MITVEMMIAARRGMDRIKAASFATLDRVPMLTGTLVTVAGFIPVGLPGAGRANIPIRCSGWWRSR